MIKVYVITLTNFVGIESKLILIHLYNKKYFLIDNKITHSY